MLSEGNLLLIKQDLGPPYFSYLGRHDAANGFEIAWCLLVKSET